MKRITFLFVFSLMSIHYLFSQHDSMYVFTSISEAMKSPSEVYKLDLSHKKLNQFPVEVFQMPNLKVLILKRNKIESVPSEIGLLSNLEVLDLSANRIAVVPSEIGALRSLKQLILNRNYISSLPDEISTLVNLEFLDLWSNEIDTFPASISNLKENLKLLDMRAIVMNDAKQQAISELLPNTKILFSKSCLCQ